MQAFYFTGSFPVVKKEITITHTIAITAKSSINFACRIISSSLTDTAL